MMLLAIESSCDETAAAVLADGRQLLSDVIHSQITVHAPYGGVVPELASRNHIENISLVVQQALDQAGITLDQLDGIAVTQGPGLVGCLLVGLSFAKALAMGRRLPLIGVDHIAGHLLSVFLGDDKPAYPFIALAVSGGHTSLFQANNPVSFTLLGRTRDDAAGEAFDKVAKLLGLGYPGGPIISTLAREGNLTALAFPRAWLGQDNLDFSFSGLKTAVANHVHQERLAGRALRIADICASFQEAVVEVLVTKAMLALKQTAGRTLVLAGGVAANPRLRAQLLARGQAAGYRVCLTPARFCTDNAAMIALAAFYQMRQTGAAPGLDLDMDAYSHSPLLEVA